MEEELRLLKEIFRPLFESVKSDQLISIALVDAEGKYIDLNGLNVIMENMTREEAIGQPMRLNEVEGYQPLTYLALERQQLLNETREIMVQDKRFVVHITSVPIVKKEEVIGAITFVQDVTSRAILEKQLIEADRMTLVGEMATRIMHDIRNPLQIINSSIQMIGRWNQELGHPRIEEKVGLIKNATCDVIDLMNNMLQFCKPEAIKMEAIDLHQLVMSIGSLFSSIFIGKGIQFKCEVDPQLVVFGDYKLLKQVLMNIIQNAIDVLEDYCGERQLYICGRQGKIQIFNTGPIIPPTIQEQIFDTFFSTKGAEGTGLGLAICKEIVEKVHGGEIRCLSSTEVGGTTFEIQFSEEAQLWMRQAAEVAVTSEDD